MLVLCTRTHTHTHQANQLGCCESLLASRLLPLLDQLYQQISHHSTSFMQTATDLRAQVCTCESQVTVHPRI